MSQFLDPSVHLSRSIGWIMIVRTLGLCRRMKMSQVNAPHITLIDRKSEVLNLYFLKAPNLYASSIENPRGTLQPTLSF